MIVQSTLAREEDIRNALQDLKSGNPIKKQVAQWTIEDYEKQKWKLQRKIERVLTAKQFKEYMYAVGGSIIWSAEQLSKVPNKVSQTLEETTKNVKEVVNFVQTVPTKVDKTVTDIKSTPTKVQETTEKVQNTVENTVETTQKVVQNKQSILSEVERKVVVL